MFLIQSLVALSLLVLPIYGLVKGSEILTYPNIVAYLTTGTILLVVWIHSMFPIEKVSKSDVVGFGLFAGLHLILAYLGILQHPLWLDEITHYQVSMGGNFLAGSQIQQQMPLSYLHSALTFELFAFKEWAPRFFPLVWGSLGCGAFYITLKNFVPHNGLVWLGSLWFCSNPWVIRYSQEGRPIAFAIFSSTLYLFFIFNFISKPASTKSDFRSFVFLFIPCLLLLSSTFLQPAFLILSLTISLLLFWRLSVRSWAVYFAAHILAVLICLPQWVQIYLSSQYYVKSDSFEFFEFFRLFTNNWSKSWLSHSTLLCLVGAAIGTFDLAKIRTLGREILRKGLVLPLFLSFIFTTTLVGFFLLFVQWWFAIRYGLTAVPIVAMISLWAVAGVLNEKMNRNLPAMVILLMLGLISHNIYSYSRLTTTKEFDRGLGDWRSTHQIIQETARAGDLVFLVHTESYDRWRPIGLYAAEFYPIDPSIVFPRHDRKRFPTFIKTLLNQKEELRPQKIFFVHHWPRPETNPFLGTNSKYVFNGATVTSWVCQSDWVSCLEEKMAAFKRSYPNPIDQIAVQEIELELYIHKKLCSEAQVKLAALVDLGLRKYDPELFRYYQGEVNACDPEKKL